MNMFSRFVVLGAAGIALGLSKDVTATSTDVVLDVEGNPTCESLGSNHDIISIKDTRPPKPGRSTTVTGPDGQQIHYTVGSDGKSVAEWEIVSDQDIKPVNYTILKGYKGARAFHFGAAGVTMDTDEPSRGWLKAVSFCYGLSGDSQPPEMTQLPDCEELSYDGGLAGTGIHCPTYGQRVLLSFDPNEANFATELCTCNVKFEECDPNVAAGELNACPSGGINERVPVNIQGVEDPNSYICTTIGGFRRCFTH